MTDAHQVLITGFPERYLAMRIMRQLLDVDRMTHFHCIVRESQLDLAKRHLSTFPAHARMQVKLLVGNPESLDLGLSGSEFSDLAKQVEVIHHCASDMDLSGGKQQGAATVNAAREILEFAEDSSRLKRLVHWSSVFVSGARTGLIQEKDLTEEFGFHSPVEEGLYHAEAMMREAMNGLPITILRLALLVGDSRTGQIDVLSGPHHWIHLLLTSPKDFRVPAPMRGNVRVTFLPVDYAVAAAVHISLDARSVGRTFHLVDPKPLTARRAFELLAEASGKRLPTTRMPLRIATALGRLPGAADLAHGSRVFLEHVRTDVIYDDRNARDLLQGSNIQCPELESYVDTMVDYVRSVMPSYPQASSS